MPAPIAPLVGFVLGVCFAWAAAGRGSHASAADLTGRPLLIVSLFSFLVFAPVCVYFAAFAPDWSYAYLIDSHRLPGAVDLAAILVDVASVPAGFGVATRRARDRKPGVHLRVAALPLLLGATFIVAAFPQLGVHATYAQYHGDFGTQSVAGSPLGYALLWMDCILLLGAGFTARALRRLSGPIRGG